MDRARKHLLVSIFLAFLLSQNLVFPVMATTTSFQDQKNYYSPEPHSSSPPRKSHRSPTPSHGSGGGSYGGTPPTHTTPSTPGNCGTPPYVPTPSTPTYNPPPTPITETPPTPVYATPPTPVYVTPPTPTITPATPSVPTPPLTPNPNSPFSCTYWKTHPELIWGIFGWWGTLGSAFGVTTLPGFGSSMSLPQALSNKRNDGYGLLYREGTASLLNSIVNTRFPFTTNQVRDSFVSALGSNKAAASQGRLFKMANEGQL